MPSFAAFKKTVGLFVVLTVFFCRANANVVRNGASANFENLLDVSQMNVTWKEFEINFANLHQLYSMAVFPSDDTLCKDVRLFIFVPTRPTSFSIRNAIRQTWAKELPPGVVIRFVIGRHAHPDFVNMLLIEQKVYGDLLINDIEDTYDNLYLKVYSAFAWQQEFCGGVEYVLKVDDDDIVDVERLLFWIDKKMTPMKEKRPSIIFGRLVTNVQPIRIAGQKWYVPRDLFSGKFYPPYTPGLMYLLSNQAVSDILSGSAEVKAFLNEDALYTGVIAERRGIARIDVSEHFKDDREITGECDEANSVPLVVSLYGFPNADDFAPNYRVLHGLECK